MSLSPMTSYASRGRLGTIESREVQRLRAENATLKKGNARRDETIAAQAALIHRLLDSEIESWDGEPPPPRRRR